MSGALYTLHTVSKPETQRADCERYCSLKLSFLNNHAQRVFLDRMNRRRKHYSVMHACAGSFDGITLRKFVFQLVSSAGITVI
jgi:hypothetical protein